MDKVVDHLLVFNGEGDIKDFPGNYSQYREWEKLEERKPDTVSKTSSTPDESKVKPRTEQKRKLSFKEKQEFAQLEQDIERLETEKAQIESALSSGTISVEQITEMSKRLPRLVEELDEKSMRWLELSELA